MFKKIILCVGFFIAFLLDISEARQGCCSHHGGVCGCGCCDGTPLSAMCAPYYDCGESRTRSSSSVYDKEEIVLLQTNLKKLGYYEGKVDGITRKTTVAIKSFQREHGLDVTGIADSYTVHAIENAVKC